MQGSKARPFRYTRGKLSVETTLFLIAAGALLWKPIGRPCVDAVKAALPLKSLPYHPVVLIGCGVFLASYLLSAWVTLALVLLVVLWALLWPVSYLRHVDPRIQSFKAGFRYRYRLRRKLSACRVLRESDPVPTISWVRKQGCITTVRVKMCYGHHIEWWREDSAALAQTHNAADCKINLYRRETLIPWRREMVTKYRWLVIEYLTKDPFSSKLGTEYIDYYRKPDTFTPVLAVKRIGEPEHDNLAAHKLAVAMTRWGKSVRIRARIYAHRDKIRNGELEIWGIDGKGGVEQAFMKHILPRTAYGDTELNPNAYDPHEFDRLLKDAVRVLKTRQRRMRGIATEHTPTPDEPWLLIVIDEVLVLTSDAIDPHLRKSIAASIMLIQQQGIACGVSLDCSTQLAQMELLPFRKGFTDFELGKIEQGAVDMVFGRGWWERGARADEIPDDLKGTFYKKTESTMAPEQIRYPNISVADVSEKALGFKIEKSRLWPPRHLQPVPDDQSDDEPEPLESEMLLDSTTGGFA